MKYLIIKMINLYQKTPLYIHNHCRFIPTCSEYSKEAIIKYGVFKGCKLSIKRIIKCHPFGNYGYDPVPELRRKK